VKDKPSVSVIIATHNRAKLLEEALQSVYGQECSGDRFEMSVIVVDDGSSDSTPQAISKHQGIQYIRFAKNRGPSAARNAGIKVSKGKYIAFLDDDDLWLPRKLVTQIAILEDNPTIGVVYGQQRVIGERGSYIWPETAPSGNVFQEFLTGDKISINTLLVRRDAFEKSGYFDETLRIQEHYEMCLRLAFYVPFVFMRGEMAIQRISRDGNWHNHALSGDYEEIYSGIIERALFKLQNTSQHESLKCRARAWVFCEITKNLALLGERRLASFERMHSFVVGRLRSSPWLAKDPVVSKCLARNLLRVSTSSRSPKDAATQFCAEIKATLAGHGLRKWWSTRRFLGDIWMNAAFYLGSGINRKLAAFYLGRAILHNPAQLTRKRFLFVLAGVICGTRADFIRTCLRGFKNNSVTPDQQSL
jgi:glycosyltransferase involved in cell wall biosynthesis